MARTKKIELPDTMSDLILLALTDLIAVEKQKKRFTVDMGTWHEPEEKYNQDEGENVKTGRCIVCFAGSVMAQTLKEQDDHDVSPESFDLETRNKLNAIDSLRQGDIHGAAQYLGISIQETINNPFIDASSAYWRSRHVIPYYENLAAFKIAMRGLAKDLKKAGL